MIIRDGSERRPSSGARWALAPCSALALALTALAGCSSCTRTIMRAVEQEPAGDPRERQAVELYEAGRFAEAQVLLAELDSAGMATGPLLYRLAYCQRVATGAESARATELRARTALEQELASADDLEVPFYLVNTYQNLGLGEEVRRVATEAVARVEGGELDEPRDGVEKFRLGKLYADLDRADEASRWYSAAVDELGGTAAAGQTPYVRWASRFLADRAMAAQDWAAAATALGRLTAAPDASAADLDRFAVASVRVGRYADAEQAWTRAARLVPAEADRPRYSSRLAAMATGVGTLPATAPNGKSWTQLGKEELEALMLEQARAVQTAVAESSGMSLDAARREELQARIDAARPLFLAAGLEYTARGHGIRETAFMGGYAPLVFHDKEWSLR